MTAMTAPLEPIEFRWVETASPRMRETGRTVYVPTAVRRRRSRGGVSAAAEHVRAVGRLVWFGWLTAVGLVVGGTVLVVIARVAWVVLRWAVAL